MKRLSRNWKAVLGCIIGGSLGIAFAVMIGCRYT